MSLCSGCGVEGEGPFCASCGRSRGGGESKPAVLTPAQTDLTRVRDRMADRHGIPALLSLFVPGLGQMIKGQFLRGGGLFVLLFVLTLVPYQLVGLLREDSSNAGSAIVVVGLLLLAVTWILQVYDAYAKPDAALRSEMRRIGVK